MRLLYLTNDRSARVSDFYGPLQRELAKVCDLTVIRRPLPILEGRYCRMQTLDGDTNEPLVDPVSANEFDWIITDAMYSYLHEPWGKVRTPKAVMWADQHGPMVQSYIGRAHTLRFDLFLPLYRDSTAEFHPYLPQDRVRWFPYWVDEKVYRRWEGEKRIGVLQTGVVHDRVYPWRQRVFDALDGQDYFQRVRRPPESMERQDYWPVWKDYGRLLAGAHIATACTSKYHYPVTKLFEIPACGTALACDWIPEMHDLGFRPKVNMIELAGERDSLRQLLEGWLADPERLADLSAKGYELMHTRFAAARRAADLVTLLAGFASQP